MQIRKIVAGMDFSAPSTEAARWATSVLAPDAELVLAHIVDVPRAPDFLRGSAPTREEIETSARSFAESTLREIATYLTRHPARTIVRVGRPHEELAKLTAEVGADLLVIGPHGDRPRSWKMLGTTAERIVRAANPAVLVASGFTHAAPRRLLAAVDDGPARSAVLEWAKGLSNDLGAEITALHVLSDKVMGQVLSTAAATSRDEVDRVATVSSDMIGEATRWLELLTATGIGADRAEAVIAHGKAADSILDTAREIGADLIVLGRRGTGTLIPAVLGSTVSTVLHGASCPVLVVTEDEKDWDDDATEV